MTFEAADIPLKTPLSFVEWIPFFLGIGIALYFSGNGPPSLTLVVAFLILLVLLSLTSLTNWMSIGKTFSWKALTILLIGFLTPEVHRLYHDIPPRPWFVKSLIPKAFLTGTVQTISFSTDPPIMIVGPPSLSVSFQTKSPKYWFFSLSKGTFRIRLQKNAPIPKAGDFLEIPVRLFPILPSEVPSGFDAKRWAYFSYLLGRGISLGSPHFFSHDASFLQKTRTSLAKRLHSLLPSQEGAIAAALLVGDRSAINTSTREAFTDAGIAHVLAISGLHLTLITGLFFFMIRRFFCLIPWISLRYDTKKIAVPFSFLGGAFYLALSGTSIATQRAFLMLTTVLLAILLDRAPVPRRSLMIAAFFVLMTQPTALFMPSFSLSFFAVLALIIGHGNLQREFSFLKTRSFFVKIFFYVRGLLLSSFLASLATIPFTLYYFQKFTVHALATNLLAIPLMAFWIMPCALLAVLTWPLKGEIFFFPLMGQGIHEMIKIAEVISKWPGASIHIPGSPPLSLGFMMGGSFMIMMGKNFVRWGGIVCLTIGLSLPFIWEKPHIFISNDARNVGVFQNKILTVTSRSVSSRLPKIWSEFLGLPLTALRHWPKHEDGTFQPIQLPCGTVTYERNHSETSSWISGHLALIPRDPSRAPLIITEQETKKMGSHFITCCSNGTFLVNTTIPADSSWPWHQSFFRKSRKAIVTS